MEIIPHLDLVEIMKQITDAFFVLNRNGEFKFINKRGAEILNGNHPNDLIGKLIWDEFPEVLKSNFHLHYYRTVMEKQIPVEFDEFFPEPLNRWYHVRVYPITDGITVFIHDTTDKKLRQKRNAAYYERLFMKNHDGILLLDVDGKITNVNDGIERISGYRSSYLIDKQYFDLEVVKREDLGLLRTAFQKVRKGDIQHG
ncbi:MAG: PAS domain S-box protein, partial [Bacillus sp. (in: Bacteria)]|nr:PAS domain S-box protein [Bacillus sp. (in: firmicutes)]